MNQERAALIWIVVNDHKFEKGIQPVGIGMADG